MKTLSLRRVLVCLLTLSSPGFASHEIAVRASSLVFRIAEWKLEVTAETDDNGNLSMLRVSAPQLSCAIPKSELTGIESVDLGSLRFLVTLTGPGQKLNQGHLESFTISLAYGDVTVNLKGDEEVHAFEEVCFWFDGREYRRRTRYASEGDETSSWRVLQKYVGKDETQVDRIEQKPHNPVSAEADR